MLIVIIKLSLSHPVLESFRLSYKGLDKNMQIIYAYNEGVNVCCTVWGKAVPFENSSWRIRFWGAPDP